MGYCKKYKKFLFLSALFIHSQFISINSAHAVAAGVSGTLSIIPGLGQVVNGDGVEGLGWFSTSVGLLLTGNSFLSQIGFDLWMYNMYDAYRDAKPSGGKTKNYTVVQNYVAAFNPANIIDPIGGPIVLVGAAAGAKGGYPAFKNLALPITYGFVGMGEEGLFRGFLFPGFSDLLSSAWAGAITSSALFAVVHATGGRSNLSGTALTSRFLMGMLFCWQADRNKYDLRNNIFAHTWWDIFVDDNSGIGKIPKTSLQFKFFY